MYLSPYEIRPEKETKKRLPSRIKEPLIVPSAPNKRWRMDFMRDALTDGRRIRVLNVTDDFNREALAIEAALSFPAERVIRVMQILKKRRRAWTARNYPS